MRQLNKIKKKMKPKDKATVFFAEIVEFQQAISSVDDSTCNYFIFFIFKVIF